MNILVVTFSLRNPERDYNPFFVAVKGNAVNWLHFIEQMILVSTSLDAQQFSEQLYPHLEPTDSLFVAKIASHEFQGWLPTQAWYWLNDVSKKIESEKQENSGLVPRHPPR